MKFLLLKTENGVAENLAGFEEQTNALDALNSEVQKVWSIHCESSIDKALEDGEYVPADEGTPYVHVGKATYQVMGIKYPLEEVLESDPKLSNIEILEFFLEKEHCHLEDLDIQKLLKWLGMGHNRMASILDTANIIYAGIVQYLDDELPTQGVSITSFYEAGIEA